MNVQNNNKDTIYPKKDEERIYYPKSLTTLRSEQTLYTISNFT